MEKIALLQEIISSYTSALIAFSGGVDSTFLAYVAKEVLGKKVLLVTASLAIHPDFELEEAKKIAAFMGLKHLIINSNELDLLDLPEFSKNHPDRCYYCKRELFTNLKSLAAKKGYAVVFDGNNMDDTKDYRPGIRALKELSIRSPLGEAGLTKEEIRALSSRAGLPTAKKPSFPCLASRFPYGEEITKSKLERVNQAEIALRDLGFIQFRVRSHGQIARIEFIKEEMETGWVKRELIQEACQKAGFIYVTIDIKGYRTGALNEVLSS